MNLNRIPLFAFFLLFSLLLSSCNKDLGTGPPPGPKWKIYTKASTGGALIHNGINGISVDSDNRIWFSTDGGVSVLRGSIWTTYTTEVQYSGRFGIERRVTCTTHGADGSTWIGLAGGGVRRYNPASSTQQWTSYTVSTGDLSGDIIKQIVADRSGPSGSSNIWVVPFLSGVSRYKPRVSDPVNGDWQFYSTTNGLPTSDIYSVQNNFIRRKVLFGTAYGELVTALNDGSEWNTERVANYDGNINALAIEGSDIVWVATVDGVFRRTVSWTQFVHDTTGNSIPSNTASAITIEASGIKWIGTDNGLARFDNFNWQIFNRANSPIPSDTINALTIDIDGKIWIGTANGAAVYNPDGVDE